MTTCSIVKSPVYTKTSDEQYTQMHYLRFSVLLLLFTACSPTDEGVCLSTGPSEFVLDLGPAGSVVPIAPSAIEGRDASLTITEHAGKNALELKTNAEFSDGLLDCQQLFGHSLNLRKARYLSLRLYVPQDSWIAALKINVGDDHDNFGGIPEVANNFPGNYDRWMDVMVDLQDYTNKFKLWNGNADYDLLAAVTKLSLNPYCAHQEAASSIYLNRIALSNERPGGNFTDALMPMPPTVDNVPYKFTFDDEAELRRQIAYRTFEASNQAFATGIGGNNSRAIRLRGRDHLKYIAWLPIISHVTGHPADFTKVERIYFDYYLEPGSDAFDGATLFLTSEHWDDILIDTAAYQNFIPGSWQTVSLPMADLNLSAARGDGSVVLPAVHELRLDLNYQPGKKNITMWIDNFGWE